MVERALIERYWSPAGHGVHGGIGYLDLNRPTTHIDDYSLLASQMRSSLLNSNAPSSIAVMPPQLMPPQLHHQYNNHSILHRYGYPPPPHSLSMLSRPHPTMLGNVSQTAHGAMELAAAMLTPPYQSRRLNADDLMTMNLSTTRDNFGTHGVAPLRGPNINNPSQLS